VWHSSSSAICSRSASMLSLMLSAEPPGKRMVLLLQLS
jgi:hypothetical protein